MKVEIKEVESSIDWSKSQLVEGLSGSVIMTNGCHDNEGFEGMILA